MRPIGPTSVFLPVQGMSAPPKATRKRRYADRPDMRSKLLDAAEAVIREEGYAAATVRRIASKAEITHQAVFYYFGNQEELLVSLYRRSAEMHLERLREVLDLDHPIRAIWDVVRDPSTTGLGLEFMALANHNEAIRAEIADYSGKFRALEVAAIEKHLADRGIAPRLSPEMVSVLTNALARLLVQESVLGIVRGHEEAEALVEASLSHFESRGDTEAQLEPIVGAISDTA